MDQSDYCIPNTDFQPANSPATFDGACPAGFTADGPASLGKAIHLLLRIGVFEDKVVGKIVRSLKADVKMPPDG